MSPEETAFNIQGRPLWCYAALGPRFRRVTESTRRFSRHSRESGNPEIPKDLDSGSPLRSGRNDDLGCWWDFFIILLRQADLRVQPRT